MKRIISLIVVCVMLAGVLSACSGNSENAQSSENTQTEAEEVKTDSGSDELIVSEDFFEWDGNIIVGVTDEGLAQTTLVIPERCEGFSSSGSPFNDDESQITTIIFESDKDIDLGRAFEYMETLVSVTLPAELTSIPEFVFCNCTNLTEISIPSSVEEIGQSAFEGAESLAEITIPSSVLTIDKYAFADCVSLKTVTFEGNTQTISRRAFEGCTSLETVNLCDSITTIEDYAFNECESLEEITLPASLSVVGISIFEETSVSVINIPEEMEISSGEGRSFMNYTTLMDGTSIAVNITEGSWIDEHYEEYFESSCFVKNYV